MRNAMLKHIDYCIAYYPLSGEINPWSIPMIANHTFKGVFTLPNSPDTNPFELAQELAHIEPPKGVCILVPGVLFDKKGTRYGRGNGWFDRFLCAVPKTWVRIGITDSEHLSSATLIRQSWDEPMDWVICKNSSWKIIKTHSRKS